MEKLVARIAAGIALAIGLVGCATLKVTPLKEVQPVQKQPVKVGIQVRGDRLHEALTDTDGTALKAVSGKLFENVLLLPADTLLRDPAEAGLSPGVDYVLTSTISDVSVNGNLNPLWFATIPLLVFKPFTPIITFESVVTLDHSIRDVRTGKEIIHRQLTEVATDHYSPVNPQEKVRALVGRAINNDFVAILEELHGKIGR